MPNWCSNTMTISHSNPEMVQKAADAWNSGKFLDILIPCPQPLIDTVSGSVGKTEGDPISNYKFEMHQFQQELNKKYFGYQDWYDWRLAHWGTKWDIGYAVEVDNSATVKDGQFTVGFDSAWSPPIDAYDKLVEMGFDISAYYFEPGCDFCGKYYNGVDECYSVSDGDYPEDIDSEMMISETMDSMYGEQE